MNKGKEIWIKLFVLCFVFVMGICKGDVVKAANDSFTNAMSISVNKAITENLQNSSDENYYKFNLPSNGYINMSFSHAKEENTGIGWRIRLYDSGRNEIKYISSQRSVKNVTSCNIGLPAGNYYVKVEYPSYNSFSTITYQLLINYTVATDWETEFNDGFLSADKISANQTVNGTLMDSDDNDYYLFNLSSNGYINMSFSHAEEENTGIGWRIRLYDSGRNEIKYISSQRSVKNVTSCNIGLPAGNYYVKVEYPSYNSFSTITYQLLINYTVATDWETEFNDGFLSADIISANQTVNGTLMDSDDNDYYLFNLSSNGYINMSFSHAEEENTGIGWRIRLYDSERNEIKYISSQRSVKNVTSCNIGLPAGNYYVKVEYPSYNSFSTITYQLLINYTVATDWETEDNGGFLSADNIVMDQPIYGGMLDKPDYDYYKITIPQAGWIQATFSHAKLGSENKYWEITLYCCAPLSLTCNYLP